MWEKKTPKLLLGYSFPDYLKENVAWVDKTLFIKKFLDSSEKTTLITRPQQFGKTMILSMLHHFLAPKVHRTETENLFDNLLISKENDGKYIKDYQGKASVIFLNLERIRSWWSFEEGLNDIALEISSICDKLLDDKLFYQHIKTKKEDSEDILYQNFIKLLKGKADQGTLESSLKIISEVLSEYYKRPVYILLDNYDTPLYDNVYRDIEIPFLEKISSFMNSFLYHSFEENPFLKKGLITGITPLPKSFKLNNIAVDTVLDNKYASYFGFSETEITTLRDLNETELKTLSKWYGNYHIGDSILYRTNTIIHYLTDNRSIQLHTGHSRETYSVIHSLFNKKSIQKETLEKIQQLLDNEKITATITTDIPLSKPPIWDSLVLLGHLTPLETSKKKDRYKCQLKFTNKEMKRIFLRSCFYWLEDNHIDILLKLNVFNSENPHSAENLWNIIEYFHSPKYTTKVAETSEISEDDKIPRKKYRI